MDSRFVIKGVPKNLTDEIVDKLDKFNHLSDARFEMGRIRTDCLEDPPDDVHNKIIELVREVAGEGYVVCRHTHHDDTCMGELMFGEDFYDGGVALTEDERWAFS